MTSILKASVILVMLLLVGFTILHEEMKAENENSKPLLGRMTENDTRDESSVIENRSVIQFIEKGKMTASWYGPRFHGKVTANGEVYNQMAFTAAHKSLKFGTLLKLTNPRNNRSVIVRINDRGPYIDGRQIDLSKGAALALGMMKKGVVNLKVEEVALSDESQPLVAINY